MTVHIRLGTKADRELLKTFTCAPPARQWRRPRAEPWSVEVQTYLRTDAVSDVNRNHRRNDQRLLLIFDDDHLVGAAAHMRREDATDHPTGPGVTRVLIAYAVSFERRGSSASNGERLSDVVIASVIDDALGREDARVDLEASVDSRNVPSRKVLKRNRFIELGTPPDAPDLVIYGLRLA